MKKYVFILMLSFATYLTGHSQTVDQEDQAGRLGERMKEYIQKKLGLSSGEAEKFRPVFIRYLLELRNTHREFKSDRPLLQLKVAEIRVKFRDEFKQILDEKRANRIFQHQREFEEKIREEMKQRALENRRGGGIKTPAIH